MNFGSGYQNEGVSFFCRDQHYFPNTPLLPSIHFKQVWFWCAVPFPKSDPYSNSPPWCGPPLDNSNSSSPSAPWCGSESINNNLHYFNSSSSLDMTSSTNASLNQEISFTSLPFAFTSKLLQVIGNLPLALRLGSVSFLSTGGSSHPTVDANFWFFLVFYYGIYCAVGEFSFDL